MVVEMIIFLMVFSVVVILLMGCLIYSMWAVEGVMRVNQFKIFTYLDKFEIVGRKVITIRGKAYPLPLSRWYSVCKWPSGEWAVYHRSAIRGIDLLFFKTLEEAWRGVDEFKDYINKYGWQVVK